MCTQLCNFFLCWLVLVRNEGRLSLLGWKCLHALCQPFHGERERLIAEVHTYILSYVCVYGLCVICTYVCYVFVRMYVFMPFKG